MHRADCGDVARGEDGIELRAAPEKLLHRLAAGLLAWLGVYLEAFVRLDARGAQSSAIAPPAIVEFLETRVVGSDEGD